MPPTGLARTHSVSLETLAYKYGTDKSKDDHKYVDLYHSLFADRRHRVYNVTEIGVSTGQSIAVWADYF
jgi:SAM-dependent methyltransferase